MKKLIALLLTLGVLAALAACQFPASTQPPVFTAPSAGSPTVDAQLATLVAEGMATQAPSAGEATATPPTVFTATLSPGEEKPPQEATTTNQSPPKLAPLPPQLSQA